MKTKALLLAVMVLATSCSEQSQIDLESEKDAILRLHNLQRDYHFNKNAVSFANQLSNNFISVPALFSPVQPSGQGPKHNGIFNFFFGHSVAMDINNYRT